MKVALDRSDTAIGNADHAVGHLADLRVVGNHHDGCIVFPYDLLNDGKNFTAGIEGQGRRRLIS